MRTISFLFLLTLSFGCKKAMTPEQQAVESARVSFEEKADINTAQTLINTMQDYVTVNGLKDSTSARYLLESARISGTYLPPAQTRIWYRTYLTEYPGRPGQADLMAEYITVSEKMNQPEIAEILYKSFANRFPDDARTAAYTDKIRVKDIPADSLVRQIGLTMFNDSTFRLDEYSAELYVELCQDLVMANPNLPDAPEYLHRAAETARTLRSVDKAINLYDWIIDKYPTSKRAATSLFLKAFTLDNDLHQYEEAGEIYKIFLERYPNDEFTESAQFLLDNLGRSEEELKQMLLENAEKNPE